MTKESDCIKAQIKYKDIEKAFSGDAEEVWLSINEFFQEFIPTFEIANKLMLNIDLQRLTKDSAGIIAFSKEGPSVLVSRNRLTDNETLILWLLANYVGCQLGILKNEAVSKEELQTKLGKDAKITSTRLGELIKNQIASRTTDEEYKITTFGITQVQKEILPKIKAKMGT